MSTETEIAALRAEVARLTAEVVSLQATLNARLASENDPVSINHKLRRIEEDTGTSSTPSSSPPALSGNELGSGWAALTPGQRLEALRGAVCAILGAEIDCSSGSVELVIDVPPGICS